MSKEEELQQILQVATTSLSRNTGCSLYDAKAALVFSRGDEAEAYKLLWDYNNNPRSSFSLYIDLMTTKRVVSELEERIQKLEGPG